MRYIAAERLFGYPSVIKRPQLFKVKTLFYTSTQYRQLLESLNKYQRHTFIVSVTEPSHFLDVPVNVLPIPYYDLYKKYPNELFDTYLDLVKLNRMCAVYTGKPVYNNVFRQFDLIFVNGPTVDSMDQFIRKVPKTTKIACPEAGYNATLENNLSLYTDRVTDYFRRELANAKS